MLVHAGNGDAGVRKEPLDWLERSRRITIEN
jgi:hypothetical protein